MRFYRSIVKFEIEDRKMCNKKAKRIAVSNLFFASLDFQQPTI